MKNSVNERLISLCGRYPLLSTGVAIDVQSAFEVLKDTFERGGKVLVCGNGGSASDADHIAGELMKGFALPRRLSYEWCAQLGTAAYQFLQEGLPAIPLANLTGLVSAYNNDCHPDFVFAQLTWVLGRPGDTLLCLSTSGNSKNILEAARVANAKRMGVVSLTGESGGHLKDLSGVCIRVPELETYKIQELHLPVYHTLCLMLEAHFFGE
jgi:D-sedoheptulose 7-phosphate isomerase